MRSLGVAVLAALSSFAIAQQPPRPADSPKAPKAPAGAPAPAPVAAPVAAPAAPAAPAIELLLAKPRALDAARTRRLWRGVLDLAVGDAANGDAPWLAADGAGLVGAARGVRFTVAATTAARTLDERAVRHLDGAERATLRAHAATWTVRCVGDAPPAGAARTAAYTVLGGVAAALLSRDVVGVGALDHGTFEPAGELPELRETLTGDDPLAALAPMLDSSLVLFLRGPRKLDEAGLERAFAQELGTGFGGDAPNFVVVRDGMTFVRVGDEMVLVAMDGRIASLAASANDHADLRLRSALADHGALLRLQVRGDATDAAEAARRRLLARLAAAMWGDDVLALSWHCDRRLLAAHAEMPAQLRTDDPVAATLGDPVIPILEPGDPDAMAKAIAEARAMWSTAVAHHRGGGALSAKFPFATRKGGVEHVWIAVRAIDGSSVRGTLDNEPHDVEGLKHGAAVTCQLAELSDWMFVRDGKSEGGFTVKVLDRAASRK